MEHFENFNFYLRFALMMISVVQPIQSLVGDLRVEPEDILPEDVKSYDKLLPPFEYRSLYDPHDHDPITVELLVSILGLNAIDEVEMTFSTDIFFAQIWQDHRLNLANQTNDRREYDVKLLNHIWQPDSYFRNAKSVEFQKISVPNHYLRFLENNTIKYTMKVALELFCKMDFAFYPHDTQKCNIRIESLSHRTNDLQFVWAHSSGEVDMDNMGNNFQLPQSILVGAYLSNCTFEYEDGKFVPCMEVVFILKRSMGYYLINHYIPTSLIIIMSWISFWIRPDAVPARVTLGVTSLLTLLTQHSKSQETLPRVSYFKMVDAFMLTSTVFVFMVLIEYCVVIIILDAFRPKKTARKSKTNRIMPLENNKPNFLIRKRLSFPDSHKRIHRLSIGTIQAKLCDSASLSTGNLGPIAAGGRLDRALLVDRVSRILFPASFIILNCVYWFYALFAEDLF